MKNIYGEKGHLDYVQQYRDYLSQTFTGAKSEKSTTEYIFADKRIEVIETDYVTDKNIGETFELKIYNGNQVVFHKDCIERPMTPYFFFYNNEPYMLYRQSLYGYSIVGLETLTEFNYFPDEAMFGESFIITSATLFHDILVFEGCFWGAPYGYRVTLLFGDDCFDVFNADGSYFESEDKAPEIRGKSIFLFGANETFIKLNYNDIVEKLN